MKPQTLRPTSVERTTVELNKTTYIWTGTAWFDSRFIKPPAAVIKQLNELLDGQLANDDSQVTDVYELTHRARVAREAKQFARAELLAHRILAIAPQHHGAAAVLCACLRARGLAHQAVDETEQFMPTDNVPLLTSRAAALCDVGRWEDAKRTIGRALAIQQSEEAFLVVKRIKVARPELYPR